MSKIVIAGKEIEIKSLKRKDIKAHLGKYGFTPAFYEPVKNEKGEVDRRLAEEGYDLVIELALGKDMIEELDELGGNGAIRQAYLEIIAETYGSRVEEKN